MKGSSRLRASRSAPEERHAPGRSAAANRTTVDAAVDALLAGRSVRDSGTDVSAGSAVAGPICGSACGSGSGRGIEGGLKVGSGPGVG